MEDTYLSKLATAEQKAFKQGYIKGRVEAEKEYMEFLYLLRCNMTSITRFVRLENDSVYKDKYKALADTAVSNILQVINNNRSSQC